MKSYFAQEKAQQAIYLYICSGNGIFHPVGKQKATIIVNLNNIEQHLLQIHILIFISGKLESSFSFYTNLNNLNLSSNNLHDVGR